MVFRLHRLCCVFTHHIDLEEEEEKDEEEQEEEKEDGGVGET